MNVCCASQESKRASASAQHFVLHTHHDRHTTRSHRVVAVGRDMGNFMQIAHNVCICITMKVTQSWLIEWQVNDASPFMHNGHHHHYHHHCYCGIRNCQSKYKERKGLKFTDEIIYAAPRARSIGQPPSCGPVRSVRSTHTLCWPSTNITTTTDRPSIHPRSRSRRHLVVQHIRTRCLSSGQNRAHTYANSMCATVSRPISAWRIAPLSYRASENSIKIE